MSTGWLIAVLIAGLIVGRSAGWSLSRLVLYPAPNWLSYRLSNFWAIAFALICYELMTRWAHPGWFLKVIVFGECGYLATANYGLINDSTVPPEIWEKHRILSSVPTYAYIISFTIIAVAAHFWK